MLPSTLPYAEGQAFIDILRPERRRGWAQELGVWGLGFRVCGFAGLRAYEFSGLRVYGVTGLRVYGFTGLRVYGFTGLRVYGLGLGFRV